VPYWGRYLNFRTDERAGKKLLVKTSTISGIGTRELRELTLPITSDLSLYVRL
jgi:hypothetical protein